MARKSTGTIPPPSPIADANQAVALLDGMHHWTCSRENSGDNRGYSVTITHAGKRVTAYRRTFIDATIAAFAKLRGQEQKFMRLAT